MLSEELAHASSAVVNTGKQKPERCAIQTGNLVRMNYDFVTLLQKAGEIAS